MSHLPRSVRIIAIVLLLYPLFIIISSPDLQRLISEYKSFPKWLPIFIYYSNRAIVNIYISSGIVFLTLPKLREIFRKFLIVTCGVDWFTAILGSFCTGGFVTKDSRAAGCPLWLLILLYIFAYSVCYLLQPLLIFFLTRPKIKEQFKQL
jgi:hypothetical protein